MHVDDSVVSVRSVSVSWRLAPLSDCAYCSLLWSTPDTLGPSQVLLISIKSIIYFVII